MTNTQNPTLPETTSQAQSSLNALDSLTDSKSKRGGKRPGAGRPAEQFSVRSIAKGTFEEGSLTAEETHYKAWRGWYVFRKAHPLIYRLSTLDNKDARPLVIDVYDSATLPPLLGPHQALQLARIFSHEHQIEVLLLKHRAVLERFVDQYGNYECWEELVGLAKSLLQGAAR
jgi:hypothetical protein